MLDEKEKKELAEKISQQRRAMWKGKVSTRRPKKRERRKKEQKSDTPKPRSRRNKDVQPKISTLKTALFVIIGLICAIAIGMAIGYLAASFDLIKI